MEITPMQESDLPQAADLECACFAHPWSEQGLRESLLNGRSAFFAAREGERVIGYAGMQCILDEGYVENIAVYPRERGRGAGDALVRALLDEAAARGLSFLTLEARASNEAAISLYQKNGFEICGRRRAFYEDPTEDALLMTHTITYKQPEGTYENTSH